MRPLLFAISLMMLFSCDSDDEFVPKDAMIYYGTSFGECIGYCITETYLEDAEVTIIRRAWGDEREPVKSTFTISTEQMNAILGGIDEEKFKKLPETLGCPDCADGGAEWLEVDYGDEKKRVTFEYMDDIDGISDAVQILRELTMERQPEVD